MLIQCTKALLDKVGIKQSELVSPEGYEHFPNSFMAWHTNFVSINRRKAIILMNNETRYSVVIELAFVDVRASLKGGLMTTLFERFLEL